MRQILIIFSAVLLPLLSNGQSLDQFYCTISDSDSECFSFSSSEDFKYHYRTRLGSIEGSGKYQFTLDSLILKFHVTDDASSTDFLVLDKEISDSDSINITVEVVGEKNQPLSFVNLALTDTKDFKSANYSTGTHSDISGKANIKVHRSNSKAWLHLFYIGSKPLSTQLELNHDYHLSVKVYPETTLVLEKGVWRLNVESISNTSVALVYQRNTIDGKQVLKLESLDQARFQHEIKRIEQNPFSDTMDIIMDLRMPNSKSKIIEYDYSKAIKLFINFDDFKYLCKNKGEKYGCNDLMEDKTMMNDTIVIAEYEPLLERIISDLLNVGRVRIYDKINNKYIDHISTKLETVGATTSRYYLLPDETLFFSKLIFVHSSNTLPNVIRGEYSIDTE